MKGDILGSRYSIQQQLGKKPGRYTYLALDNQTQSLVVVKLLKLDSDFEWDSLKLFEREAQILQNLSHSQIPGYLDFFDVESPETKGFALVQSYIDAKSLEEQVKKGRTFSEAELKEIAEKLLNILIYLHDRKPSIIHRDIKPSNILLTNRSGNSVGEVYLVDFGSVQNITAAQGGTLTIVGTYGYMSPEHFGGRSVPTSDLYSLGATLIYLATGTHPADFPQKDLQIQFEDKTQLSPHFTNWLKKTLEPSQEKRFSSAKVALEALKNREKVNLPVRNHVAVKPVDSKILLIQNADKIEIVQPGIGYIPLSLTGNLLFNILLTFLTLYCLPLLDIPIFGWSIVGFLVYASYSKWKALLCEVYGIVRLSIDKNKISFNYELFGLKFKIIRSSLRQNIIKLEYAEPFIKEAKDSNGNKIYKKIPPSIIIWAGNIQYQLSGMTETEFDWLSQELSNWLQLPVQYRLIPIVKSN